MTWLLLLLLGYHAAAHIRSIGRGRFARVCQLDLLGEAVGPGDVPRLLTPHSALFLRDEMLTLIHKTTKIGFIFQG